MTEPIRYLALGRKAGLLEIGEENVGTAVRAGKGRLLMLAKDASDNAVARARGFVYGKNTPIVSLPYTKEEISDAVGKTGCSMAVFTDIGMASSFADAMESLLPTEFGQTALELREKKAKMAQRKAEAKAHERNKKTGKRRTKQ